MAELGNPRHLYVGDDLFVRCAHLSGSFGFGPSGMFLEIFRVFFSMNPMNFDIVTFLVPNLNLKERSLEKYTKYMALFLIVE